MPGKLNLPEGTKICKECEGRGWVYLDPDDKNCGYIRGCLTCGGDGYVDWITYAMGVKPRPKPWIPPNNANIKKVKTKGVKVNGNN